MVDTHHATGADGRSDRAQDRYLRWDPDARPGLQLLEPETLEPDLYEIADIGLASTVEARTWLVDIVCTRTPYLDLHHTLSDHAAMQPEMQARLFGCLSALIESRAAASPSPT